MKTSRALRGLTRSLTCVLVGAPLGLAAGCGPSKRTIALNDDHVVGGTLRLQGALKPGDVGAWIVGPDGTRAPPDAFTVAADGAFSIKVKRELLHTPGTATPADDWAAHAFAAQADPNLKREGAFAARTAHLLRVEFTRKDILKNEDGLAQTFPYSQVLVPLSRQAQLAASSGFATGGAGSLALAPVGRVKVIVTDSKGVPLPDAWVTALPVGTYRPDPVSSATAPLWRNPLYKPVRTKTDAQGSALVFPVPAAGADARFQILVARVGACGYATPAQSFSDLGGRPLTLELETCDGDVRTAEGVKWTATYPSEVTVARLATDAGAQLFGLTNGDKIQVRLNLRALALRPLLVRVYEGDAFEGTPRVEKQFDRFASDLNIGVPTSFAGNSENGRFSIRITSVFSDADRRAFGAPPSAELRGVRSVSKPVVDKSELTVTSGAGTAGVLSGRADGLFSVATSRCADGYALGALLGATDVSKIVFVPCVEGKVTLKSADVLLAPTRKGGEDGLRVFLRDAFGNVSENHSDGRHVKTVYVDYGAADPATQSLQFSTRLGFARVGDRKGTSANPFLFGYNETSMMNETLRIARSSVGQFVLRYAAPDRCKHDAPSEADGLTDERGQGVSKFTLAGTAEGVSGAAWTGCADDRGLADGDFTWPASATGNAEFYLRVLDLAGNASSIQKVSVPACTGAVTADPVNNPFCWEP